jgi:hypothetical protein
MFRSSRTSSGGQPRATGIRSARPSRVNVPACQRTGIRARLRRGYRAEASPALRRAAAANQASEYRRSTDLAPTLSSSPKVPGPDAASSRYNCW